MKLQKLKIQGRNKYEDTKTNRHNCDQCDSVGNHFARRTVCITTMATKDDQSVSRILGYTPMTVESDSMKPTFCKGDLIFIKKCDTSKLKEGDIITFHTIIDNQYALNTHRIQKIDEVNGCQKLHHDW